MDELEPVEDRQEAVNRVFMVGTHPCIITAGGTRMACKKCSRYVTTYQSKWRNLGTLSRQACKPKGAQPALPPGSLSKGRTKGPNKKLRLLEPAEQAAPLVLSDLPNFVE
eukprot:1295578-Amphidinium_carterae.1